MLIELMDGRALTANELARAAHVRAPTASRHLAMLVDAGLLVVEQQGRHRCHRLASAAVARVIESIMALAVRGRPAARTAVATGPRDLAMRRVRQCYDHLAGRLGVAIAERLQADGSVVIDGEHARVGAPAAASLKALGIDVSGSLASLAVSKRPACQLALRRWQGSEAWAKVA